MYNTVAARGAPSINMGEEKAGEKPSGQAEADVNGMASILMACLNNGGCDGGIRDLADGRARVTSTGRSFTANAVARYRVPTVAGNAI